MCVARVYSNNIMIIMSDRKTARATMALKSPGLSEIISSRQHGLAVCVFFVAKSISVPHSTTGFPRVLASPESRVFSKSPGIEHRCLKKLGKFPPPEFCQCLAE